MGIPNRVSAHAQVVCGWLLLCLPSTGLSQVKENPADGEQALVDRWLESYDAIRDSISVMERVNGRDELIEEKRLLLTVVNPAFRGRHGRTYVWTKEGRPVVVGSFMSQIDPVQEPKFRHVIYEFNSLSPNRVQASRRDRTIWHSDDAGITWLDEPRGNVPAKTAAARLVQMRAIARRFTAHGPSNEFRLMPQPIYRYTSDAQGITDGAIFSYALTSDPCVWLLIEARDDAWHYAFARSNSNELKVSDGPRVIWSVPKHRELKTLIQDGPYYLLWSAERRLANDPDTVTNAK
jgi:hypothetical protein